MNDQVVTLDIPIYICKDLVSLSPQQLEVRHVSVIVTHSYFGSKYRWHIDGIQGLDEILHLTGASRKSLVRTRQLRLSIYRHICEELGVELGQVRGAFQHLRLNFYRDINQSTGHV